jgi:hypothetical protein
MILRSPQNQHGIGTNHHTREAAKVCILRFEFSGIFGRCTAAVVLGGAILLSLPAVKPI